MTQNKSLPNNDNSNEDKVQALGHIMAMRVEEVVAELGVRLYKSGNKLIGACPVHGGRKSSSLNIYPDGHTVPGYWKCRSHHCELVFKKTIIGFIRGVLSHNKYGWEKKGDRMLTFEETLEWCCAFLGQNLGTLQVDKSEIERRKFAAQVETINGNIQRHSDGVPRSLVKSTLAIPADFFVRKNFSPDVLTKFDVGLCDKQGKEMYNRVVVPVYDETKSVMIGCTGRSIYPECPHCRCYHNGNGCPSEEQRWLYSKWKHSKNFNTGSCLYNYWNAKKYIKETGVVILVEGPADVWRLEECGIYNAVALFGCELTEEQQVLLESSGAMSVIILLDNDEPGRAGCKEIAKTLDRYYNIYIPEYSSKDIGDMPCVKVKEEIVPIIENIQLKNKSYSF